MKTRMVVSILVFIFAVLVIAGSCASYNKTIGINNKERVLSIDDFLIIEIKEEDARNYGIKVDYDNFDNTRYRLRRLHSLFLREFRSVAKYLILDFWYSDHGIPEIDNELVADLSNTKNVTLCAYGIYKEKVE